MSTSISHINVTTKSAECLMHPHPTSTLTTLHEPRLLMELRNNPPLDSLFGLLHYRIHVKVYVDHISTIVNAISRARSADKDFFLPIFLSHTKSCTSMMHQNDG